MNRWWAPVKHCWTLLIVLVGWVIFRSDTIGQAGEYLMVMIGMAGAEDTRMTVSMMLASKAQIEIICALLLSMPLYPLMIKGYRGWSANLQRRGAVIVESAVYTGHFVTIVLLSYLTIISLAAGVYNPFIYFRF